MELGPQNHSIDGLLGPNSIIVVYMDPLGTALNPKLNTKLLNPEALNPNRVRVVIPIRKGVFT